ncbi:MAG: hypothetical protein NC248_12125 [Bacteroides sp.]|nr:hypothetical protein [Muribaculum sp.]MCM1333341.1 hypothetical protein [Bacteroides sp.]
MAKQLTFQIGNRGFSLEPVKVDRKKIYGWSETQVTDQNGSLCSSALLNDDGMTVAPSGATKPGMLSDEGQWVNRDELVALDGNGTEAKPVASSFDEVINLRNIVSLDDFLSMNIDSIYQLAGEEAAEIATIIGSNIYGFDFSYRGGYQTSDACILASDGNLFVLMGTRTEFPYVSIGEEGILDEENVEEAMEEEIDFNMF